jgi:hypothetical protein
MSDIDPMNAIPDTQQALLRYLAGVGPTVGRIFGIRDFNAMVMMNAFSASDRDGLRPALDALVERGILSAVSATEYSVTPRGRRFLEGRKRTSDPARDPALEGAQWS